MTTTYAGMTAEQAEEVKWRKALIEEYSIAKELATMKAAREVIEKAARERSQISREQMPTAEQAIDIAKSMVQLEKVTGTNAEQRRASLDRELATDEGYQAAFKGRTALQSRLDTLDAEIESNERKYSAARHSLEWKTAALRLLGGAGA